jgi:hypothetical protein
MLALCQMLVLLVAVPAQDADEKAANSQLPSRRENGPELSKTKRFEMYKARAIRQLLHPIAGGGGRGGASSVNTFRDDQLAEPYLSQEVFREHAILAIQLEDQAQGDRKVAEEKYEQKERQAIEKYGLDLHRLFQILCEVDPRSRSDAFFSQRQVKDAIPTIRPIANQRPDIKATFEHLTAPPSEYDLETIDPKAWPESMAIGSLNVMKRNGNSEEKSRLGISSRREDGSIMSKEQRMRLRDDKGVRELLFPICGKFTPRWTLSTVAFRTDQLAEPYVSQEVFKDRFVGSLFLEDQAAGDMQVAEQNYEQKEKDAIERFGLDLHRLFQLVCENGQGYRDQTFFNSTQLKTAVPSARSMARQRPDLQARFEHLTSPPSPYDLEAIPWDKFPESMPIGSLKLIKRDGKNENPVSKARSKAATKTNQPPKKR